MKNILVCISMCQTPLEDGPTSGPFRTGPLHSVSCVGLGPVDGSPPGRLTEASWCWWHLRHSGLCRTWATVVLKRVPPISWIRSCYSCVSLRLHSGRSGGGDNWGGLGYGGWDGEIFNGWHWKKEKSEAVRAPVINVLALNSVCFQQWGNCNCFESRGLELLLPIIPANKRLPAAFTSFLLLH